jgi:2,4-dienoyl-CoA reductase-like NADH-dependent reductase (Old Yellow Enzyme family)
LASALFEPGTIGGLEIRNRFLRPATSETMADEAGSPTEQLVDLYETLARNEVGLVITGHLYVHSRGQYAPRQSGIYGDSLLPRLAGMTGRVRRHGARFFAQLAHAGSQSRVPKVQPLAPSPVPNALTGRMVAAASEAEIEEAIEAFGKAAARAVEAGFDGVHIHGANGYLISEFASPLANRRSDRWGGSPETRDAFPLAVVEAVRAHVPPEFPVTMKIGFVDAPAGGLGLDESVRRAGRLVEAGIDAVEVSCGVMGSPTDSAKKYVAVDRRRAIEDLLAHRVAAEPGPEAYFREWARRLRKSVETNVMLVGGMRRTETMEDVVVSGDADFIAMARPLIREPDLIRQIKEGRRGRVDCTSCNLCLMHEGHHSLRCWRTPRRRLLQHAVYRLRGGLRRGLLRTHD